MSREASELVRESGLSAETAKLAEKFLGSLSVLCDLCVRTS